jgi:hypothetical protein
MGYAFTNTAASTAAVTNRYVTSTNMKVGAYTLANTTPVWSGAGLVTVTHTTVVTTDTLGTIIVVGTDLAGQTRTETLTPTADATVTGAIPFRTITSITGAGWVIAGTNDTLVCGVAAGNIAVAGSGQLAGVLVNNSVAAAITISDGARTILTIPASQAAGTYYNLHGVDFLSNLKVATTSTNDVTVFHTSSLPTQYAMS